MAILNVTPDSFSDGGQLNTPQTVVARALEAVAEGADILDLGGESTRPGSQPVTADTEWSRVGPALAALRRALPTQPISIDTRKWVVARRALDAGADFVNDTSGIAAEQMAGVVAAQGCSWVLMRVADVQGDVVAGAVSQLNALAEAAQRHGVARDALILDPGLGFGDPPGGLVTENLRLLREVPARARPFPTLIGASRKRFVGTWTNVSAPARRVAGSVQAALEAVESGAAIVRVHDVKATVDALGALRGSAN